MTGLHYDPAEELKLIFLSTAYYRRKSASCPRGSEHTEAAILLEELTGTIHTVDTELLNAFYELLEDDYDYNLCIMMLDDVGFESWPRTATEFVRAFIANQTGGT
jgi:hypothetical protein